MEFTFAAVETSDKSLIDLIRESDYTAYTNLYNRYWRQLFKIAWSKTGSEEDASDLVQEFFIELWNRRAQLKIEKSVEHYLISALYYKVFMHFRKRGFEEKHLQNYTYFLEQPAQHSSNDIADADQEAQYKELLDLVEETVLQMPEKMKQVFDLKHKQSMRISEIAEVMGISSQTVKNQLSNAMLKLRKAAGEQGVGSASSLFIVWLFA